MKTEQKLRELLAPLEPAALEVVNESDLHSGPPGRESHFRILLVSKHFEGLSRVDRNRMVHARLGGLLMANGGTIHALTLRLLTEPENSRGADKGFNSPDCSRVK